VLQAPWPSSFLYLGSRPNTDMLASRPVPATPASNTGLFPHSSLKSSIDTLTIVLRAVWTVAAAREIVRVLEAELAEVIEFCPHRPTFMMRQWSGCSTASLRGTQLHWQAPSKADPGQLRIHIPGLAIAATDQASFRDCIQVLMALYAGECTRVDVAVDDGMKLTNMSDLFKAQRERNYKGVRSHRRVSSGGLNERDGVTCYFGSKMSDLQLRIYDKAVESKGKVDVIRWELQLRRHKAKEMCRLWLDIPGNEEGEVAKALSGAVAGAVDFIDRSKNHKDLTRCQRLPWWEKIRAYFGEAYRLKPPAPVALMEKKIGWICESVMPSLATVKRYLGDCAFWQFVEDEVSEKTEVLSDKNKALAEQAVRDDRKRFSLSNEARLVRELINSVQLNLNMGLHVLGDVIPSG
jgi:hypothetical protein